MASVLTKNSSLSCRYRHDVLNAPPIYFLPEVTNGISTSLTFTSGWQAMPMQANNVQTLNGNMRAGKFFMAQPSAVDFTVAGTNPHLVTYEYEITGVDHFGEPIVDVGAKTDILDATNDVVCRTYRVFSVINGINVRRTDATGGTQTITCGINTAVGVNQVARGLPLKLTSSTSIAGVVMLDPGGVTYAGWPTGAVKPVSGYVGFTTEDTPLSFNNSKGWTPRKLAQVGVFVYGFNQLRYTSALPAPVAKVMLTPDALSGT